LDELELLGVVDEQGKISKGQGVEVKGMVNSMNHFRNALRVFKQAHMSWVAPRFNIMALPKCAEKPKRVQRMLKTFSTYVDGIALD